MLRFRFPHSVSTSPAAQRWVSEHGGISVRDHINYWLQVQVAVSGPKVFRPTLDQCLAMEQVAPRIPIGDYAQPYPVMLIDLPEEYQRRRACAFGSCGVRGGQDESHRRPHWRRGQWKMRA